MMDWETPEYDKMQQMAKSGENLTPRVILRAIYEITGILLQEHPTLNYHSAVDQMAGLGLLVHQAVLSVEQRIPQPPGDLAYQCALESPEWLRETGLSVRDLKRD